MAVSITALNELRDANATLLRAFESELRGLSSTILDSDAYAARDALLEVAPSLGAVYSEQAAVAAAEWYEQVRAQEIGGRYTARIAGVTATNVVREDIRWVSRHLFSGSESVVIPELSAALSRKILYASNRTIGYNTIEVDQMSVGWQRIARPNGCDFCVMLAARGAVYKRSGADFASHNNCRCRARPSWDDSLPEVDAKVYEASKRTSKMGDEQKERHQKALNEWMEDNKNSLESYRESMRELV